MDKMKKILHKWLWAVLVIYCLIGIVYPLIGLAALICMLAPSIAAVFRGRMWCGNYCPRGSFNDTVLSKISMKRKLPGFLKTTGFRLFFLVFLMGAFVIQIVFAWGNFIAVSSVFVRMIIMTTVLTIILGIVYSHRTWCIICPMGTMASYAAKLQPMKTKNANIAFDKKKCMNCRACSKSCPMGIDVLSYKETGKVVHADCLKCKACVEKCPKESLYMK